MITIKPYIAVDNNSIKNHVDRVYCDILNNKLENIMVMYENDDFIGISAYSEDKVHCVLFFQDYGDGFDNYFMRDGLVKATFNSIYLKGYLDVYIYSTEENLDVHNKIGLSVSNNKDIKCPKGIHLLYAKLPEFFETGCHSKKEKK